MYSILLADDERWVRTSLRKTIEKTNMPFHVVHEATNGLEAADWLAEHDADLVLADIRMPVMDGLALLEKIKINGPSTDVIIISGHDDFHYAQQAIHNGVFDYLLKPVETDILQKCFENWLNRKKRVIERGKQPDPDPELLSPIEQVIRYVETQIPKRFSLKEAAEMAHHNPSYFSQVFKQKMNKNFVDFVTEVRIKEAQRLLSQTSLRIYEIADRLGFNDLAYFSNLFKKMAGMTPSEFRKKSSESSAEYPFS